MKKIILFIQVVALSFASRGQVLLNEVYTDPGAGKNEFFELYNRSVESNPLSLDNYTLVTFFEIANEQGFCVMDLPNLFVNPKGYFVGASSVPFNYQGVNNTMAVDFSWNSSAFTSANGYIKKWLKQTNDLTDGNPDYDEIPLPVDFNDFFQRRTGNGASFSVFLYRNGTLINALSLGSGGSGILSGIISMPPLYVDMSGGAQDFWIDFSGYGSVPVESVGQDGGSDNGFIREADGMCGSWTKSSSQVQHTPQQTNGYGDALMGDISATAIIQLGNAQSGSDFIYDVIAAPVTSFPIELQVYKDMGPNNLFLDAGDEYIESNFETVVTDGPFTTNFTPYDMNMLLVVISNVGCIDKILYAISTGILPVKLIYFKGELVNNSVGLQWKVSENEMVNNFEVEKSVDGINFIKTGFVLSNDRKGEQTYQHSEITLPGQKIFYRLKIISRDQKNSYSSIIAIHNKSNKENKLKILGNPVKNKLDLSFVSLTGQTAEVNIYGLGGQLKYTGKIKLSQGNNIVNIPLTYSFIKGVYIAELQTANEKLAAGFIVQ
jgi:hypothetical protein